MNAFSPEAPTRPVNVVVVDDSPEDLMWISRLIKSQPKRFAVSTYETAERALTAISEQAPDVILIDQKLGHRAGLDVIDEIRADHPFLPAILMTGQGTESLAAQAITRGASAYLCKSDVSSEQLARELTGAIVQEDERRKLAEQGEWRQHFIRTLVHDIRAPLRHILTHVEFLEEDLAAGQPELAAGHIASIRKAINRTDDLVRELKIYACEVRGDLALKPTDMREAAEQAVAMIAQDLRAKARFEIANLPEVMGHEPQVVQLLHNLILNGLKYNRSERPAIQIFARTDMGTSVIVVRDNGIGIQPEFRVAVFEPLKRLHSADDFPGTGFGLAICKQIVRNMGGRIWVDEGPERGTDVFMEFPNLTG